MAHLISFCVLAALPAYNLAQGATVEVLLPPTEAGGPPVDVVVANLIGGSLAPHCSARVGDGGSNEAELVARTPCGCFGRAIDADDVVAALRLAGRQTAEQKLTFADDLRQGRLYGKLAPSAPAEATDFTGTDQSPAEVTPGEEAYEIYCAFSDGKSLVSGDPLPGWFDQSEPIRAAWEAAASALLASEGEPRGQVGYDAYVAAEGGKSLATGQPLPAWAEVNELTRAAWDKVARDLLTVVVDTTDPDAPPAPQA